MDTVSLRITLRYKDLDEFVKRYAENISSAGLFLRTRAPKPTGTKIRFELLLADGVRALRGEGVVVTVREDDKPGMALRFNVLDAESRAVVDRIVKAHGQGSLAPTPLATSFGRDGAAPEVAAPPASGAPAWRAKTGRGWSSMGAPPSRSSSSVGPGGLLPRRPSRAFGVPEPTLPRPEPLPERGPVLPRSRSELPRPWAAAPLPGAPMDEDERTQRLDVDKLPEVMRSLGAAVPQDVGVSEPEVDDDVAATDERLEAGFDAHEAELGADGDEDEGAIVEAELHEAADADADDEAGELRGDDEAAAGAELPGDDEAA
ncbi:MAG: TIGR02266 family protein, partial [Myxococcales bacterium]|nr:TIGR02266 family protein [Myxococcales bacterium]